jgi:CubicO group peptidase (beta-lactamase class C family)
MGWILTFLLTFIYLNVNAQMYFPSNQTEDWETISPQILGWETSKIDSLYQFLEANNTKAFILLKDGKIVLEKYFNGQTKDSKWYWASAGKSLTAFMIGIAQQEKYLKISDPTSHYLGKGWTNCPEDKEKKITILDQLIMTTGLAVNPQSASCTEKECLQYKTDAGKQWAYHTAPYTLLDQVIENATENSLNQYIQDNLNITTGIEGQFVKIKENNVFISTARSMARFGLLILNKGSWNGEQILNDSTYFNEMTHSSQNLNPSYGYLWWLNGKSKFMLPNTQMIFDGPLFPDAPIDLISALGKNGQFINVIPSQNMVWIRMGNAPDDSPISFPLNNKIWKYIDALTQNHSE